MNKNELIDNIIDAAWIIKVKYKKYRPSENFNISIDNIQRITVCVNDDEEINGMIYYSYLLYLGCLDYE